MKLNLEKNKKHNIEIVVDRIIVKEGIEGRLTDSIRNSIKISRWISNCRCYR